MGEVGRVTLVAACVFIAWVGEFVHNRFEMPQLTLLSPENSLVLAVGLLLYAVWYLSPAQRLSAGLLLGWGLLHLVGAILTVLPLDILPFDPEQNLQHYLFHILYGLAQFPLILVMIRDLRSASGNHKEGATK